MIKIRRKIRNFLDTLSLFIDPDIPKEAKSLLTMITRQELIQKLKNLSEEREDFDSRISREILILSDSIEGVARGDLTVVTPTSGESIGFIGDIFNIVIENMIEIVGALPSDSPLRKKFKLPQEYQ
jgi:methyl-accepting chemotaxis protein